MMRSPDGFTSFEGTVVDQPTALRDAFVSLQESFVFVDRKLKDPYLARILRELLTMANEFFALGDKRNGTYAMQEVEGTVWPSTRVPPRHAPEAERRAHGQVERYVGVVPSPYPYQGTKEEMGEHQRKLYLSVWRLYMTGAEKWEPGQTDNWLLLSDGQVVNMKAKSRKAATQRFRDELATGAAMAALRAQNVFGDLYVYDVEEPGKPRVSVRGSDQAFRKSTPNWIIDVPEWTSIKVD
jgi:hypothetical protein